MAQYRDYQGPTVGQSGCSYSSLRNVYSGQSASGESAQMANYIVPKLCPNGAAPNYPPRYDTLSHGQNYLCGGYFNMQGAYPLASCTDCKADYIQRPCTGNIARSCQTTPPSPVAKEGFRFW